jgi:hypothetical protein
MILLAIAILAQSPNAAAAAAPRRFEVVSIKPSRPGATMQDMRINLPPGRIEALNITLNELLLSFSGFSGKVEGAPKWADTERYDIEAKAATEIAPANAAPCSWRFSKTDSGSPSITRRKKNPESR